MPDYTIHRDGKNLGPYSFEQARAGLASGEFAATDLAWCEGMTEWKPLAALLSGGAVPVPQNTPAKKPFNWLWLAILSTLCCCLPAGVAAIIFATKANDKHKAGDVVGAKKSATVAMISVIVAAVLAIPVFGMGAAVALPAIKAAKSRIEQLMISANAHTLAEGFISATKRANKEEMTWGELKATCAAVKFPAETLFSVYTPGNADGVRPLDFWGTTTDSVMLKRTDRLLFFVAANSQNPSFPAKWSVAYLDDGHVEFVGELSEIR